MTFAVKERVQDTTVSVGAGALVLDATVVLGRKTVADAYADGDKTFLVIEDTTTGDWEVTETLIAISAGIATIARTTLRASSTGSPISFAAGTKNVFSDIPAYLINEILGLTAGKIVYSDVAGHISSDAGVSTDGAGTLTATTFVGALTGNASTSSSTPANGLTGTTLAASVVNSSLLNAAGGVFGTAAFTASSLYGLVASPLSQFASTTSAQLASVMSDETGTGLLVFGTSPILTTPNIGAATATAINGNTITPGTGTLTLSTFTLTVAATSSISGTNTGDNPPPFVDSTAIIKGSGDATKLFRIEVDGFTTGTTRVFTPPDANLTITAAAGTVLDDTTVAAMVDTLGGASSSGTGGLVRIDSATLTGTPAAPTAAPGTNTTQLATTAFVLANGGSSSPFVDSTAIIKGSGDATKLLRIEVDGLTTSTTRVWAAPDSDLTVAGINIAQTFTAAQTFSANGAASAPSIVISGTPFAGTGTTSFPLVGILEMGATASTTWSTAGTYIGINAHGAGDLMNLMKDGVSKAKITNAGVLGLAGSVYTPSGVSGGIFFNGASQSLGFYSPSGSVIIIYGSTQITMSGSYFQLSNNGKPMYSMASAGTNLSFLQNDSSDTWSIATGTVDSALGSAIIQWTKAGQVVFSSLAVGSIPGIFKGFAARTQPLIQLRTSADASLGNAGGCIFDDFADTATTHTDGTFDTISTHTIVANSLQINGDKIEADFTLTMVGHAVSTDQVKVTFAGITIFDSGANNFALAGTARLYVQIIRKTSTTCRAVVEFIPTGSATIFAFSSVQYTPDGTLTGLTLSGTNVLAVTAAATGTNSASGDVTCVMGSVDIIPAGS